LTRRDLIIVNLLHDLVVRKNQVRLEAAGALKENYGLTATYKYDAKIITLGDLNDGPFNNSVKKSFRSYCK
jgi:hypothetical protein